MAEPFKLKPLVKQSFIEGIVGLHPKENAIIEINNALADAQNIKQISLEDIRDIASSYKIHSLKELYKDLGTLYRDYLKYCLEDKVLTEEEKGDISHLRILFELNEEDAHKIYAEEAGKFFKAYVDSIVADERLSPDEDKEMLSMASSFGIDLQFEEKTKQLLDKFRSLWFIDNSEMPEIETTINLQRNEKCYFSGNVDWFEYRRALRGVAYSGPTFRFRIAKGLYWRMGDLGIRATTDDSLTQIDSGQIYITNKRLIFIGNQKGTTIRLPKILDVRPYQNGVEIQKDAGKNPFLEFNKDVDIFCAVLARVIKDQN